MIRLMNKAFTLIELLVVIAIIALLVAILMPSLQQAKVLAGLASCQVNMKSLYVAMMGYKEENNGYLPWVAAYKRGQGATSFYVDCWDPPAKLFFAGCMAKDGWIAEPHSLVCPGTRDTGIENSLLLTVPMSAWVNDPASYWGVWGSYALRWGGRMDKVYANRIMPGSRLMLAEGANVWRAQQLWSMTQHGGRMTSAGDGRMCMNVCASDGAVRAIMDWTNPNQWEWSDLGYWPYNERTGDIFVNRYPDDIWDWSDGAFGFWTSFDRELYAGAMMPWGENFWPPMGWDMNP